MLQGEHMASALPPTLPTQALTFAARASQQQAVPGQSPVHAAHHFHPLTGCQVWILPVGAQHHQPWNTDVRRAGLRHGRRVPGLSGIPITLAPFAAGAQAELHSPQCALSSPAYVLAVTASWPEERRLWGTSL